MNRVFGYCARIDYICRICNLHKQPMYVLMEEDDQRFTNIDAMCNECIENKSWNKMPLEEQYDTESGALFEIIPKKYNKKPMFI